ncbi:methyl-accepting chemotaxis protein [Kineococcus sp. SYSU DK002]|uniref:methyl-accepting chemotaxis protein n=1 Tax=Kineococcus sp. SYSU DK002 TaxID=3383123 RepID=UPI003D7D5311
MTPRPAVRAVDLGATPLQQTMTALVAEREAVLVVDGASGAVLHADPRAAELCGTSVEGLSGRTLADLFAAPGDGDVAELLGDRTQPLELLVQSTADERWARCSSRRVDGTTATLVLVSDVTAARAELYDLRSKSRAIERAQAVVEFSPEGTVLRANDNFLELLGYEAADVVGQHHRILCDATYAAGTEYVAFWRRLRAGSTEAGEFTRYGARGQEVRVRSTYNPVFGADGKVVKVIEYAYDVTDSARRSVELEGRVSAIDRSQAVIEFDLDGTVLHANDNFLGLLGYSLAEVVGQHHRIFVDPDDAVSTEYQRFWEKLSKGNFDEGTYRRITKDGRDVFIQATYNPILDPEGRPLKVVKYAVDVTRNRNESAEYASRSQAVDRGQAVIEFDLEGNVLTANENFLRTMGYSLKELQGQHHSLFCSPEYRVSAEYRDFWLRLRKGDFIAGRFHRVGKFDRDVWIQATYNPIFDLRGEPFKVIKYAYDVTAQAELEQLITSKSGEMNATVAELSHSIDSIASNALQASDLASQTHTNAEAGFEALKSAIAAIELIRRSSGSIAEIVRVITEIAAQTNLLAFNASIEAARAGEHGVGFSVVAGEVRKLAERSSSAAGQIAELIAESETRVTEGAEVSRAAQEAFESIVASVARTSESISTIAGATQLQQDTSAVVRALIGDLACRTSRDS